MAEENDSSLGTNPISYKNKQNMTHRWENAFAEILALNHELMPKTKV